MFHYQDDQQCWTTVHDLPSPPTFPFSPPTFNDDALHDILLASYIQPPIHSPPTDPSHLELISKADPPTRISRSGVGPGKRAMRKDRHSKINTAQGPRDRRMRLSLDVARDFFDLQDTLGYDKASKTMKWLLTMSASAIKDLMVGSRTRQQAVSELSTSECNDSANNQGKPQVEERRSNAPKLKRKAATPATRRVAPSASLARESRAKARERARERTREKKWNQQGYHDDSIKPNQLEASSFESIEGDSLTAVEERCSSHHNPINEGLSKLPASGVGFNHILGNNQEFIDYHETMNLFRRQCEMDLLAVSFQGSDPAYLQFLSRSWEILNNNQNPVFM